LGPNIGPIPPPKKYVFSPKTEKKIPLEIHGNKYLTGIENANQRIYILRTATGNRYVFRGRQSEISMYSMTGNQKLVRILGTAIEN
jgi:hypothetical protein